ncbi:MAG: SUMF1/EgtB/PvdO family nonheme iron enzyme [Deltaproteobacteria bacterium]|nr:SUMF1/EgtB/PvdO family nonheme iron enzyme [Deltaproteobacteria bacterium]
MERTRWAVLTLAVALPGCRQALDLDGYRVRGEGGGASFGECVPVPSTWYLMGSNDGQPDEQPVHEVAVAAFCLDRTEVTVAAYAACAAEGKCTPAFAGGFCNAGVAGRENHPINCVDWNQATAYCKAQGQRLPTEEEWEYAARGTDGRRYPWGNAAPSNQLCWDGEGNDQGKGNRQSTCAVGAYPSGRSPFGLDDLSGNVWEWTASGYSSSYSSPRSDTNRVYRGGSWDSDDPSRVRSAARSRVAPTDRSVHLGFRCAGSAALP